MPYIGNNHIAGDHTNNFKVLDDISSFTATFDGSASSVVDTTNNTIRVVEHRFIQGQRVTYTNGSGGNIGGLATGTAYFVIFDTANTIKLATNASNAANSTAINLSAVGTGSSHTLNAAFDGVNTKFKITYNGGTGARFNNATQLNIAINNVLQKPNVNSSTFTEGFAIEDNHKIVFKNAPTNQDIFWGSIIANTLTTFDISDHKIDTFTGDGSTTEFTLSHTPANNESLMVTINGVLQHPSNASTARAYTLIASIIQFTAAPANGDEIQVRHLGFAGATTADVSGFYGRTGNVVLGSTDHITTGDITARNINASGILTASSASFGGNVSIGGTLTYEDVSNIDSVGIITARDGIHVGAGVSAVGVGTFSGLDISGDIDVDGHTNLDNVSIAGVTTTTGFIESVGTSGRGAKLGGLSVGYDGLYATIQPITGTSLHLNYNAGTDVKIGVANTKVDLDVNGDVYPKASGNRDLGLTNKRWRNVYGTTFIGNGDFVDIDVDGHTNLDNVSIAGVTTITENLDTSTIDITGTRSIGNDALQLSFSAPEGHIKTKNTGGSPASNLAFHTTDTSGNTNRVMHLRYDGKVGINTTVPSALLNVNTQSSGVADAIVISRDLYGMVGKLTNSTGSLIVTSNKQLILQADPSSQFTAAGSFIGFETDGTEKARVHSNGYVGINSTAPGAPLELYTAASAAWKFRVHTNVSDGVGFYQRSNGDFEVVLRDASNNNNYIAGTSGALVFNTSNTEKLRINSTGHVTKPLNPAFHARPPAGYSMSGDQIIGGTWSTSDPESFVRGTLANGTSIWDNSTGIFKVPVDGVYYIHWNVFLKNNTTRRDAMIYRNGTASNKIIARTEIGEPNGTSGSNKNVAVTTVVSLSVNDTIQFGALTTGGTQIYTASKPWSYACAYLVG